MKFIKNSWGYYETKINFDDKIELMRILETEINNFTILKSEIGYYFLNKLWFSRSSGMVFDLSHLDYYPKLKKYLDQKFKIFMRKEKLKQLNEI